MGLRVLHMYTHKGEPKRPCSPLVAVGIRRNAFWAIRCKKPTGRGCRLIRRAAKAINVSSRATQKKNCILFSRVILCVFFLRAQQRHEITFMCDDEKEKEREPTNERNDEPKSGGLIRSLSRARPKEPSSFVAHKTRRPTSCCEPVYLPICIQKKQPARASCLPACLPSLVVAPTRSCCLPAAFLPQFRRTNYARTREKSLALLACLPSRKKATIHNRLLCSQPVPTISSRSSHT